jgi:ribosomal protein L6P/L9E
MSRIGNKVVEIPAKVKVNIGADGAVAVEGPKGSLAVSRAVFRTIAFPSFAKPRRAA